MEHDPSTPPSPMPSVEEILTVMAINARLLDPGAVPNHNVHAAEVIASGDATRPLQDPAALLALAMRQLGDQDFAHIAVMVAGANVPAPEVVHAMHWRFHNAALALRKERGIGAWESLVGVEELRRELVARTLSPEVHVAQLERIFRIQYRTALNILPFDSRRSMVRMLNSVVVYGGPKMERLPNATLDLPSEDTATVAQLNAGQAAQLEELFVPMAQALVQAGTQQVYAHWGEPGYLTVKNRLTVEHFIAQAQAARAE